MFGFSLDGGRPSRVAFRPPIPRAIVLLLVGC